MYVCVFVCVCIWRVCTCVPLPMFAGSSVGHPRSEVKLGGAGARVPHWCLFMWSARWSEREKHRPQWWHLKGLAPVCFRKWRVSSSERANLHSQPSHEHRYGFSPAERHHNQVRTQLVNYFIIIRSSGKLTQG